MKFLSTILALITAYDLSNAKAVKIPDVVDELNTAVLLTNRVRRNRPDLSPTENIQNCACLTVGSCNPSNVALPGKPCTGNQCGYVSERMNDGTCESHLVLCCQKSIYPPTPMNILLNTIPQITPMVPHPSSSSLNSNHPDVILEPQIPPCPCIPESACYRGTPCTNGCNAIDLRTNDGSCLAPNVLCCKGANNTDQISSGPSTNANKGFPDLTPGPQMPTCPCVDFYQCYNGTACTDGCAAFDIRINDDVCVAPKVLCCKGLKNTTMVDVRPAIVPTPGNLNLNPTNNMLSCPCIPQTACYNGTPCTDGCNAIDMRINDDSCTAPNVLCCKTLKNSTVVSMRPPIVLTPSKVNLNPTNNMLSCPCIPQTACNNGTPCTDGCNAIDMRINDGSCLAPNILCCKEANNTNQISSGPSTNNANKDSPNLTPGPQMPTCPCIPFYQCYNNGTPCTDGCAAIDIRINDDICLAPNVLCCKSFKNSTMVDVRPAIVPTPSKVNLNPTNNMVSCPCIPQAACNNGTPCTDGCNAIDMRINDGSCLAPNILCCKEANNTNQISSGPPTNANKGFPDLTPGPQMSTCPCVDFYQCYNGTACTDGCAAFDIRINDDVCVAPKVLCCKGLKNTTMVDVRPAIIPTPSKVNLNPTNNMLPCPCIPQTACYNGTPCTDGCNAIDMRINDDSCMAPNVLCCKGLENSTMVPIHPGILPTPNKTNLNPMNNMLSCPCIPHTACYNGTPCTDGCNAIDMRINHNTCPFPNVLCCQRDNVTVVPPLLTPSTSPTGGASKRKGCGVRHPTGVGYRSVTSNKVANFGEFPWMVAIFWEDEDDYSATPEFPPQKFLRYKCGGSLIHPQVVLTSTHCVVDREKTFQIRAGEWNMESIDEIFPHQDRSVVKVIIHPEYYSGALYNDIALLILDTPLDLGETIDTVCLPPQDEILENVQCFTSGWGTNVKLEGKFQAVLKKVALPVVPRDTCEKQLKIARSQDDFMLHESFVCAGGEEGKDSCEGDGGSPLVCPFQKNTARYYQGGIVAWGVGCGKKNVPGLYANVAQFRNWVDDHMKKLGYDTSYYIY